jgi:hypothetical protein
MLSAVESLSRGRAQKNLSAVIIHPTTRTKRVAMVMTPFWSPDIAPYNIARLTALSKAAGFATCAYDLNIEAYHELGEELWSPYTDWKWDKEESYWSLVHPVIEPILLRHIDRIVEFAPDVIGFSLYYTNNHCANWVLGCLKQRLPNAVFLAGGSQAIQEKVKRPELYDHIVVGEGELVFLDILEKIGIIDLSRTGLLSSWIVPNLDIGYFRPGFFHGRDQIALVALHVVGIVQQLASRAPHRSTDHVSLIGMAKK